MHVLDVYISRSHGSILLTSSLLPTQKESRSKSNIAGALRSHRSVTRHHSSVTGARSLGGSQQFDNGPGHGIPRLLGAPARPHHARLTGYFPEGPDTNNGSSGVPGHVEAGPGSSWGPQTPAAADTTMAAAVGGRGSRTPAAADTKSLLPSGSRVSNPGGGGYNNGRRRRGRGKKMCWWRPRGRGGKLPFFTLQVVDIFLLIFFIFFYFLISPHKT